MRTIISLVLACAMAVQCVAQTQITYVGGTDETPPVAAARQKGTVCVIAMLITVGVGGGLVIWIYVSSKNKDTCGGSTRLILQENCCQAGWVNVATNEVAEDIKTTNKWMVFKAVINELKQDPNYDPCLCSFRILQEPMFTE